MKIYGLKFSGCTVQPCVLMFLIHLINVPFPQVLKLLCYLQFLKKHKIYSNRTESLLVVNSIISGKTMRILRWSNIFYITSPNFLLGMSCNETPLISFMSYF